MKLIAKHARRLLQGLIVINAASISCAATAAVINFEASDFVVAPSYSNVSTFAFEIDISGPLEVGTSYINPALNFVNYSVFGFLNPATPSGFSAFDLQRTIGGAEFYAQGSSLAFSISTTANLADGLQLADLDSVQGQPAFVFNGRELDTGRYHPALVELYSDGSGQIQNSNNMGGVNPGSLQLVNVDFGEEYISGLSFDPAQLTLSVQPIPLPSAAYLFGPALALLGWRKMRNAKH